jgi:chlorophyll synthase
LYVAIVWTVLSLLVAATLGLWVLISAAVGLALAWAYSAPPFRLKRNGWLGNAACGFSYEGLAWITGAAAMLGGALPPAPILWLAFLYSVGAHGIMTLNDFKSVDGDRRMGVRSLPVQLGVAGAARAACWIMAVPQFCVVMLLVLWQRSGHALAVGGLIGVQLVLMDRFLEDPSRRALAYSGFGVPLFVAGMMVSAFALRSLEVSR